MTTTRATPTEQRAADAPAPKAPAADRAACVFCGEPTDYPATTPGATLCPVCEWQEGEREAACAC